MRAGEDTKGWGTALDGLMDGSRLHVYLESLLERLQRLPRAIVVLTAHWHSNQQKISVSTAARHEVMYDFGGFPSFTYRLSYSPPGEPTLANRIITLLNAAGIETEANSTRKIDHGVWVPLRVMRPQADIPVVSVSVPTMHNAAAEFELVVRMGQV